MIFDLGQRWMSHADLELGLGICVEVDTRRVTLLYPSAEEERTYALDRAPLTRYELKAGDKLVHVDGRVLEVTEVDPIGNTLSYATVDPASGDEDTVHEQFIAPEVSVNTPQDRLLNNQLDKIADFQLRFQTLSERARYQASDTAGLLGARTSLLSHQISVASEVGNRVSPRVLLADEVGLGKTIEAGLILSQQILRGRVHRALITVPDPLLHQWLVEMLRRFNLSFSIYDQARFEAEDADFDVSNDQLVLTPWSFIATNDMARAQLLESHWDFVIIDEAHHLKLGAEATTELDDTLTRLATLSRGLLLLTATPGQTGVDSHFSRLQLLDPDRFNDVDRFIEEQQHFEKTYELIETLRAGKAVTDLPSGIDQTQPPEDIIQSLVDQYGTGRVLFRNARKSVTGFPRRVLHHYALPAESNTTPIAESVRTAWLAEQLKTLKPQKVLVICRDPSTAMDLEHYLHLQVGIRCASFHEGLSLIERDRAAAYFADEESGARALICSEIGSEGRNFQFAQHLVCFDLPHHPDLLEQRIGRLDRIGQTGDVHIHVPIVQHSLQAVRFDWLHSGLDAFETSCSIGHLVYEALGNELVHCEELGELSASLLQKTRDLRQTLNQQMDRGRDRLLELTSHNPQRAKALIEHIERDERSDELIRFTDNLFDRLGIFTEAGEDACLVLKPTENLVTGELPFLDDGGVTCTFDRAFALARDDVQFLTWEHPLVRETIDVVYNSALGNACVATLKSKNIKAGTVLVETLYTAACAAPKRLEIGRFLDQRPLRRLVTLDGRDLSDAVSCDNLTRLINSISLTQSAGVIRELRSQIVAALKQLDEHAIEHVRQLQRDASTRAFDTLSAEAARLQALGNRNGSVREEEITAMKDLLSETLAAVARAEPSLQGIRVVVAT